MIYLVQKWSSRYWQKACNTENVSIWLRHCVLLKPPVHRVSVNLATEVIARITQSKPDLQFDRHPCGLSNDAFPISNANLYYTSETDNALKKLIFLQSLNSLKSLLLVITLQMSARL